MEGKDNSSKVAETKVAKNAKKRMQEQTKKDQQNCIYTFHRCKEKCTSEALLCKEKGLCGCPQCHNIMKSVCSRLQFRHEDGSEPMMIKSSCEKVKRRHELRFSDSEDVEDDDDEDEEESEVEEIEDNEVDDDLSTLEKGMTLFYRTRKRPVIKIMYLLTL